MEREHIIDETCRIRTVTTGDRRGQDKARKVRAVGRGEEDSNFNHAPNITGYQDYFAMFGNALSSLNFQYPKRPR